ncbi:hypothetical protein HPP92_027734, partial [Vanilla planifolia]
MGECRSSLSDQSDVTYHEELGHFARDCPKLFELKNVSASTSGGREDASRGRGRGSHDNFRSLWLEVELGEGEVEARIYSITQQDALHSTDVII